jgi:shikimate 5-dehydrogenase/shikimate kinase
VRTLIIGHRGVGKTSFLARVQNYYSSAQRPVETYDLDQWIEEKEQTTVQQIFATLGEAAFRALELKHFALISEKSEKADGDVYLSVGAGFQVPEPHHWSCLWLRRSTDASGRIFLNRPRLEKGMDPLSEFLARSKVREQNYQRWANEILTLQEGFDFETEAEKAWVLNQIQEMGGAVTVDPGQIQNDEQLTDYFKRRRNWGLKWFELRDDLLSNEQIEAICQIIPTEQLLLSFRKKENQSQAQSLQEQFQLSFDWPLEWGPCPYPSPTVISNHQRDADLSSTLQSMTQASKQNPEAIFKLAVPIQNFNELKIAHLWQQVRPSHRSFLPMSEQGRWRWYRTTMKNQMPLQFWREGAGSAKDQPYLLEWLRHPNHSTDAIEFSAVLGDPVEHSRTPGEQYQFFAEKSMPVVAIQMSVPEAQSGSLEVLRRIGLRSASVTSPLKEWAFENSKAQDPVTEKLRSTNTLFFDFEMASWLGTNTDLMGFQEALRKNIPDYSKLKFVLWGGGGTLEMLRESLPVTTISYSSQTGTPREGEVIAFSGEPDVVVWAVGRKHFEMSKTLPPEIWKPKWILDLNYSEDSPGLEYALRSGAQYINGLEMFRAQAQGQRVFWEKKF